jgi:tellurite resistance protein TehA-like permease
MGRYEETSRACQASMLPHLWSLIRKRIEHFTWAWFSTNMATGSLAVVLYQTPHQFQGLITIGKILFVIDLILFAGFCSAMILRFVLRPKALGESLHRPSESFYFGAFWVSVALILTNAAQYASPECGLWLSEALGVCFWCYGGAVLIVAVLQYYTLFVKENLKIDTMLPAWILPIYPLLVAGPLAGTLLKHRPLGAKHCVWIAGMAFQGLGWMVTTFLYVMWTLRLLTYGLPVPSMRPGMYVSVGPTG